MKTKNRRDRRDALDASDEALRRLARAPETALKIYELAESLYMRDGDGATGQRMSLADIEQVNEYLRQTENDVQAMKKQFQELAAIEGGFQTEKIPIGF
ncbi:MAG: hypothetical protein M3367_09125 [Acidobacteriota bacterium]|nr:hypothetical protein [Acidobacteriota bacterium]